MAWCGVVWLVWCGVVVVVWCSGVVLCGLCDVVWLVWSGVVWCGHLLKQVADDQKALGLQELLLHPW